MSGDIFGWNYQMPEGPTGIHWAEASGAAKHPTMHRTASHNNHLAQNVSSAETKKPWPKLFQ